MTAWEKKIIDAFESRYFESAPADVPGNGEDPRNILRLRSSVVFPFFDSSRPDEKESYLEAAESLERKGILTLNWEKRGKGERLKTLTCDNPEKIFEASGKPFPAFEAEKIKAILLEEAAAIKESTPGGENARAEKAISLLEHLSLSFSARKMKQGNKQGLTVAAIKEFTRLLQFYAESSEPEMITTRALSILLYRDSKQLEKLLSLFDGLYSPAAGFPDFTFLQRSYPETLISGRISIEYHSEKTALENASGHILGIPLNNCEDIKHIHLLRGKNKTTDEKTVLTIENKETFYALGTPRRHNTPRLDELSRYDCFLSVGGYSNRAASALVRVLASSGFSFYHAGDLDPDGILILQHIMETAGKPVVPVRMDAATFDEYQPWARTLSKPMLRQKVKIKPKTLALPGLQGLLERIEETSLGIEQEIIDYRVPARIAGPVGIRRRAPEGLPKGAFS